MMNGTNSKIYSVESLLTRELDLRFIDARSLVADARTNLGICGYPRKEEYDVLRTEAIRIFESKPLEERNALRQYNSDFEDFKALRCSGLQPPGSAKFLAASARSGSTSSFGASSRSSSYRARDNIHGIYS